MIEFNPFGTAAINVRFSCPKCGESLESDEIDVPQPDYGADTADESHAFDAVTVICDGADCGEEYEVRVDVTMYDGQITVEGVDDSQVDYETIADNGLAEYYEDYYGALDDNDKIYASFIRSIKNLRALNGASQGSEELEGILKRQLFTSLIATMEAFLSEAFIKLTLKDRNYLMAFVAHHPEFRKQKFELREVFTAYQQIDASAKKVMLDTIYHNLPNIKPMFEQTFSITFPDIGELQKAVMIRHDLVHRNGKTKEGVTHHFTSQDIERYIQLIEEFIEELVNGLLFKPIDPNSDRTDDLDDLFNSMPS